MRDFDSFRDYLRFVAAREFISKDTGESFRYRQNKRERWGAILSKPVFSPADSLLKNIRNPLLITAAVVAGIALTTLIFYPAIVPGLVGIANGIKGVVYIITAACLLGTCLKTLGRLSNPELMEPWKKQQLLTLPIGSVIIETRPPP